MNAQVTTKTELLTAHLPTMRVNVKANYATRYVEIAENPNFEDMGLSNFSLNVRTSLNNLEKNMHKVTSSPFTIDIADGDTERDNGFLSFRNYIEACCTFSDPEWAKAGEVLIKIIKSHGYTLYKKGYDIQTSIMNSLITELTENPEALQALETVNGKFWLNPMIKAHENFKSLVAKRNESEAQKSDISALELHKALHLSYENLAQYIDVMSKMDTTGNYENLIRRLNEVTEDVLTKEKARATRRENATEENLED